MMTPEEFNKKLDRGNVLINVAIFVAGVVATVMVGYTFMIIRNFG